MLAALHVRIMVGSRCSRRRRTVSVPEDAGSSIGHDSGAARDGTTSVDALPAARKRVWALCCSVSLQRRAVPHVFDN